MTTDELLAVKEIQLPITGKRFGFWSFVLAIVSIPIAFLLGYIANILVPSLYPGIVFISVAMFVSPFLVLSGLILGLLGVFGHDRNPYLAFFGALINSIYLLILFQRLGFL